MENTTIDKQETAVEPLILTALSRASVRERREEIAAFLFEHLGEFGDPIDQIQACLTYLLTRGGQAFIAEQDGELLGAVIINDTGMSGYIPEHILVYIAVDARMRGKGIGKALMQEAIHKTPGNVALHVEPHNPARRLYERLGFENKYLEMRFVKPS